MKQKKLLALGMATLMALSSTVMAFADDSTDDPSEGTVSGSGGLEGYVDKDVFTVTLPTTDSFSFNLDPQELLLATESTSTFDEAELSAGYGENILFVDEDGNYTSKSADITIVNKSTFDVDVTVSATLTGLTSEDGADVEYDVKVLDPTAEEFGDETAITMAITPSANTVTGDAEGTATAGTATYLTSDENGITLTETVAVSDAVDDAYEVTNDGTYSYGLKDDYSTVEFNEVVFNLSGTVNTEADWTNFNEAAAVLGVDITYSVSKSDDTPAYVSVSVLSADANSFTYTLPDGATAIKSLVATKVDGSTVTLKTSTHYTSSNGTITITNANLLNSATYAKITVTFNDTDATSVDLTIQ